MSAENCNEYLRQNGKAYPRTCVECGISNPCKYYAAALAPLIEGPQKVFVVYEDYGSDGCRAPLAAFPTKEAAALFIYNGDGITYQSGTKIAELDLISATPREKLKGEKG